MRGWVWGLGFKAGPSVGIRFSDPRSSNRGCGGVVSAVVPESGGGPGFYKKGAGCWTGSRVVGSNLGGAA